MHQTLHFYAKKIRKNLWGGGTALTPETSRATAGPGKTFSQGPSGGIF